MCLQIDVGRDIFHRESMSHDRTSDAHLWRRVDASREYMQWVKIVSSVFAVSF
ncbi:hypothetical protein FRX31_013594, partial [Thalictrum thalictroides]